MESTKDADSSSSTSDSSEDEEETRKIREAICDQSLFTAVKTVDHDNRTITCEQLKNDGTLQVEGNQKSALKSNRLQDKNETEDDNNILQTTPEFRSYVAKQLSNVLDSVLAASIKDNVWKVPQSKSPETSTGIRLFSDSKTLCRGGDPQTEVKIQEPVKNSSTTNYRKHKLSTSSESSEDEKINACVFSVADIQKENERLTMMEKQAKAREDEKSVSDASSKTTVDQSPSCSTLQNSSNGVKKKKKKKRKKMKVKQTVLLHCPDVILFD